MSEKFIIHGGISLKGEVKISGSKNAVLPIIAASLLTKEKCIIRNVPEIGDIYVFLDLVRSLGVQAEFKDGVVTIIAKNLVGKELDTDSVRKMRASILLLAPILVRTNEVKMSFPGGCVLGKRPIDTHIDVFKQLGARVLQADCDIHLKAKKLEGKSVTISEVSVTATENLIMAAVLAQGKTQIRLAATEPHVQDLCRFLKKMGAKIKGIGTHFLEIEGVKSLKGVDYTVTSDYLEVGTYVLAAAITRGDVVVKNVVHDHLDIFWQKLDEANVQFELLHNSIHIKSSRKAFRPIRKLSTGVYPKFPTDLQAPLTVLLSQARGVSKVFETLFEGRLSYLFELEKLGANIEMLNPHQAIIIGPTKLKGNTITSCDIRAGAAMVIAALAADGVTEIADINYIDRGYERLEEKLRGIGARIERKG